MIVSKALSGAESASLRRREGVSINPAFIPLFICVFIPLLLLNRRRAHLRRIQIKRRKKVKSAMPIEMLKDLIGKDCSIYVINDITSYQGTLLAIENNWIKFEQKKQIRYINGDMIREIYVNK